VASLCKNAECIHILFRVRVKTLGMIQETLWLIGGPHRSMARRRFNAAFSTLLVVVSCFRVSLMLNLTDWRGIFCISCKLYLRLKFHIGICLEVVDKFTVDMTAVAGC